MGVVFSSAAACIESGEGEGVCVLEVLKCLCAVFKLQRLPSALSLFETVVCTSADPLPFLLVAWEYLCTDATCDMI